jgi:hypothetical protein
MDDQPATWLFPVTVTGLHRGVKGIENEGTT